MSGSLRLAGKIVRQVGIPVADLPVFLCPGILRFSNLQPKQRHQGTRRPLIHSQQRHLASTAPNPPKSLPKDHVSLLERLPQQCAGCGALSQTVDQDAAGFFTPTRKSIREYLGIRPSSKNRSAENKIVQEALENAGSIEVGFDLEDSPAPPVKSIEIPVCDRCHYLKHNEMGGSIHHPSIESIEDTIFESPHKYNHVYHVIDAADFPMSLVPGLHKLLNITPQRSLNRRSKTGRFYHGKKTEVSFIITRSDLLAPLQEQVDSMMPYLRSVLRDSLGRSGKDVRLGNIRCVSAKQSWWTKELKEDIWKRGGGGWMVGKVNVGKSQLFHQVFPKGRKDQVKLQGKPTYKTPREVTVPYLAEGDQHTTWDVDEIVRDSEIEYLTEKAAEEAAEELLEDPKEALELSETLDTSSLLPPVPPETDYPAMPLVSSLPGTTASPIRHSFGNGKGELIDLPGLSRGDLELHVKPEHRAKLVMHSRIQPKQDVIKEGSSLLLGGFIRITPTTPDVVVLAYAFTPIHAHRTATHKAIEYQMHTRNRINMVNMSLPETAKKIASAGIFHLKWDVTRQRTGPLTARDAVNLKPEQLPFRVLSTDILIEGCGWVELVAQIRKKPGEMSPVWQRDEKDERDAEWETEFKDQDEPEEIDPSWPAVEVFSPEGKYIASRRPMNAWLHVAGKPTRTLLQGRPRKSMKGAKKLAKRERVAASS